MEGITMNLTEASNKVESIVDELFISMNEAQVENVFTKNSVDDKLERIKLLRKCMRFIDASNSNNSITIDDEYSDELAIFLDGRWRLLA